MSVPVTLALPCRLLRLELLVAPLGGVTTLEDLVARGLVAGRARTTDGNASGGTTVSYLTWLLGVPERVVVDVIGTLWSRGHVTVDFDNGELELSEDALAKLAREESLVASGEMQSRDFLFEPVTGLILPERAGLTRPGETSIELPLLGGISESDIPPAELASSVQSAMRQERARAGRINVLGVSFGSPALRHSTKIRWLEVQVAITRDPDTDRIALTVSKAALWTARAQRRLSAHVDRLVEEEPDHPVIHTVRARAHVEREPSRSLDDLFERMESRVAGAAAASVSEVANRHKDLKNWANEIRGRLAELRRAQASVTLITRPEGHAWALEDLVDSARRQIVLVVPDPDVGRLRALLPDLRRALDRGVQLVLLWGQAHGDDIPGQAGTLMDELQLRPGSRVIWDRRSTQTEACLVIQDDCRAIVASHSQLGVHPPGPGEVGLLIEPTKDGSGIPRVVAELLEWVRSEFPRWALAQRIERADWQEPVVPTVASESEADEEEDGSEMTRIRPGDVDETTVGLWAAGWGATLRALRDARAEILQGEPAIELVRDAEHRALLWQALREAKRRLVISDDRLDPRTANAWFAESIRGRRADGAIVHLMHPTPAKVDRSTEEFAGLGRGANAAAVRLQRTGGRVVVADDRSLVGSFSPLGPQTGAGIGRRVSRVGVTVLDEALAGKLAGLLGARAVEPAPAADAVEQPASPRSAAVIALPLLLEARSTSAPGEFGRSVAGRLGSVDDPLAVLSVWRAVGIAHSELRQATAAVLGAALADPAAARTWLDWLIEDSWERGAFVEAAVLAGRDGVSDELRAAAVLAATLEVGPLGDLVGEALFALQDGSGAKTAGAAGVLSEVVVWGGIQSAELFGLLIPDLPSDWAELCRRAEHFSSVPLPLAYFRADQTRAETERTLDHRREELVAEIDKIERLRGRFDFATGVALHEALFQTGGLLHRIREAAAEGQTACRRLAPELPTDVREFLDALIAEAGEEPMFWSRQMRFLRRIEDIVRTLRDVGASARLELEGEPARRQLRDCQELGGWIARHWDGLYAEAKQPGRPYELPALRLLSTLAPLTTWVKEQR